MRHHCIFTWHLGKSNSGSKISYSRKGRNGIGPDALQSVGTLAERKPPIMPLDPARMMPFFKRSELQLLTSLSR